MKYEDITIYDCIEKVNDSLFLPDIQRPYVWDEDDVYLLFDSICRDYPFNTVLFWSLERKTLENNKNLIRVNFITERWEENKINTSSLQRDNYYLVIDGQQRITSLFLSIKGTYKIKIKKIETKADLYFNFLSGVSENEKEMLYEFQFFPYSSPDIFKEELKVRKTGEVLTKNWIRLKYIVSIDVLYEVQTKIKAKVKLDLDYEISDFQNGILFKIWSKIRHEKLIAYYDEKTQEYDKVLDIFVRTNSGGEKLSYSDLLFSYIKLKWPEARDSFNSLLRLLNDNDKFKFNHDFILKTILFIFAIDQEGLKYRTSNFKEQILAEVSSNWNRKVSDAFKLTKDLLTSCFLITNGKLVTSYNALIPIVYFVYKYEKKGVGEENDKIKQDVQVSMREWLITSMLTGVFGGQSDGILYKAKQAIDESGTESDFPKKSLFSKFNEAKPALNLAITEDLISRAFYNSSDSSLILSLLYKNAVHFAPSLEDNKPQQDHIISKSELKQESIPKEKINSIFNLRFVSASDNRIKSDESYLEWKERLGNDVLTNHFIPAGDWNASNFDEFLSARKLLFLAELLK